MYMAITPILFVFNMLGIYKLIAKSKAEIPI